jgi:hypothetical protein
MNVKKLHDYKKFLGSKSPLIGGIKPLEDAEHFNFLI